MEVHNSQPARSRRYKMMIKSVPMVFCLQFGDVFQQFIIARLASNCIIDMQVVVISIGLNVNKGALDAATPTIGLVLTTPIFSKMQI